MKDWNGGQANCDQIKNLNNELLSAKSTEASRKTCITLKLKSLFVCLLSNCRNIFLSSFPDFQKLPRYSNFFFFHMEIYEEPKKHATMQLRLFQCLTYFAKCSGEHKRAPI